MIIQDAIFPKEVVKAISDAVEKAAVSEPKTDEIPKEDKTPVETKSEVKVVKKPAKKPTKKTTTKKR